ncbi:serine/threonine-protein kinase ULK1a isoform X2 [Syngnathoides biaculeatus]|uniref:serine/threonine-protein kinase ULK1a isoform X2 n=1 Tax=Syngnathoides biaculeatus TaxID=300417 RepID=UPI002ADE77A3|nr:serine/threonine-protein kinase ULK1a isoform X2 [Syngnathoides biaculeatus]
MESVGQFEFSRKDLIGHGAFAVVFKGRHKEKHEWEVAVKCINKKKLAKSHSLLGKEIKILKELKHENIVRLLDYQEIGGCVYLVMEYCNGGDLAEYLQSKGTLSEDTIRVFLQQMAQAMKVLHSKGILHRDLKPQNILLCHLKGRRSSSTTTSVKIADFGFARYLQTNTMAATLCGSPMYMAPEVIMSHNYDAKADLWSIGTVVYQCLTGKAPFHANTPQELRLFYECNRTLVPSIPKETSTNLRQLLLGLLQRNHSDRISFDEFFSHPFLETSSASRKCSPAPARFYPSSASGSSSSSSSTSNSGSPRLHCVEKHRCQTKLKKTPMPDTVVYQLKEIANQDSRNSWSFSEDYIMVHPESPVEYTSEEDCGSPVESCLIYARSPLMSGRVLEAVGRIPPSSHTLQCHAKPSGQPALCGRSRSEPIPVPTQIQNFQRMEQHLQASGSQGSALVRLCYPGSGESSSPCGGCGPHDSCVAAYSSSPSRKGDQAPQSSPRVGTTPRTWEQTLPLSARTGWAAETLDKRDSPSHKYNSCRTMSDLRSDSPPPAPAPFTDHGGKPSPGRGQFKRSENIGRLSDIMLQDSFGAQLLERRSHESLCHEKTVDFAAPPAGFHRGRPSSGSPPAAIFSVGSPSIGNTPPDTVFPRMLTGSPRGISPTWLLSGPHHCQRSHRSSETEAMDDTPQSSLAFRPPELPEDPFVEQVHTDGLNDLQFTLAFVQCIMEVATSKDPVLDPISNSEESFLEHSLLTDQISLLSREWSYAEQLLLYLKAVDSLSTALRNAKEKILQGRLLPLTSVKQVLKKLNESYKCCVVCCRSLSERLQSFLTDKQKLMDRFNGLTAEKLIYCHTVHMVQSAALDEMFHCGTEIVQRYHKALLLLEGLSRFVTEEKDIDNIRRCKWRIEGRISALQT